MSIRSTIVAKPDAGIAFAPDSYDTVLEKALETTTLDSPVLMALSEAGSPNYILDREAFRDQRLGQLGKALRKLGMAALRSWSSATADVVEGFVYVVGAHQTVAKAMQDGRVTAGEVVEITNVALRGATMIREHTDPFVPRGPDDELGGAQTRPETGLDTSRNVVGILAKTRGAYLGLAPNQPTILRRDPSIFAELAKAYGATVPLIGSAFTALDVLTDEAFHDVLPVQPAPRNLGASSSLLHAIGQDTNCAILQPMPADAATRSSAGPYDNVLRAMREIMPSGEPK